MPLALIAFSIPRRGCDSSHLLMNETNGLTCVHFHLKRTACVSAYPEMLCEELGGTVAYHPRLMRPTKPDFC